MASKDERFVKSYPSLQSSPIWPDDGLFKLYHYCLYKASWNTYFWQGHKINPGEFPMSIRHAAAELRWSREKLAKKFAELEQLGCICMKKTSSGTLVRVTSWLDSYTSRRTGSSEESGNQSLTVATHVSQWPNNQAGSGPETRPQWPNNQAGNGSEIRPQWPNNQAGSGSEIRPQWPNNQAGDGPETGPQWPNNHAGGGPIIRPNQEYKNNTCFSSEPDGFVGLWCAYPEDRRTDRSEAVRQYQMAISLGATPQAIMDALNAAKCSESWQQDGGRFIPGISKWLQKETWRDYVMPAEDEEEELWVSR